MKLILQSIKSMIRGVDRRIDNIKNDIDNIIKEKLPTKLTDLVNDLVAPPNYEQNDETQLDYIKNRPFYSEIGEEVIYDKSLYFTWNPNDDRDPYSYTFDYDIDQTELLEPGIAYNVIINDTRYENLVCDEYHTIRFGISSSITLQLSSDGNFLSVTIDDTNNELGDSSHNITITKAADIVRKHLDPKFLPEGMKFDGSDLKVINPNHENPVSLVNHEERITKHEKRYLMNQFVLTDEITGLDYVIKMHDGEIIYYKKCTGIKLVSLPTNLDVVEGGLIDTTGMVIMAIHQDGSESEITNYNIEPATSNTITITYEEAGETYEIFVDANMISIEDALIDFNYEQNEDGTYTLTGWKGTLNGETSTRLIIPNSGKVIN